MSPDASGYAIYLSDPLKVGLLESGLIRHGRGDTWPGSGP